MLSARDTDDRARNVAGILGGQQHIGSREFGGLSGPAQRNAQRGLPPFFVGWILRGRGGRLRCCSYVPGSNGVDADPRGPKASAKEKVMLLTAALLAAKSISHRPGW